MVKKFRARLLDTVFVAVSLAFSAVQAHAQGVETVVVTGEQYSLQKSIDDKRNTAVVSDGISADEIGAIPEFGLGDALRKVPGVAFQVNNGRGEDQFLTLRGLNPDYNSLQIDGMQLVSTEETRRQISLDVLPAVLVNRVAVTKTWRADQVSDAIGGVTELHTRSAFDHPGEFFDTHIDYAYWENEENIHGLKPSGQADATWSRTFGDDNQFGMLFLASYMRRSSSSLNTYTLPYSYYQYAGSGTAGPVTAQPLTSSTSVAGLVPIPDRHRWYSYDNDRTRPGAFARFDFDDHMFHAHLSGGAFEFINDEHRYSQYLNKAGALTITSPTTGSFSQGMPEADYDKFVQYRELDYVDLGGGIDFAPDMHLELTLNYGMGRYKQTTEENIYTGVTGTTYGFGYDLNAPQAPLFVPSSIAAFMNSANYNFVSHTDQIDASTSRLPQVKLEFSDNMDTGSEGLGFKAGWTWRELTQKFTNRLNRLVPATGVTAPTLAAMGTIDQTLDLYDGLGQTILLVDPDSARKYIAANPATFMPFSGNASSSTLSNYRLGERISAFYGEAQYKWGDLYALAGLRYETTNMLISNYQPFPLNSTTNFVATQTPSHYSRLLPSFNVSYDVSEDVKLRAAITKNLGRPTYSQLAQNSAPTVSGTQATQSLSNPNLKPREATNYDLSAEWYPAEGVLASVALFRKDIDNEIVTLQTRTDNATLPNLPGTYTLFVNQAQNTDSATVQGAEIGLSDVKFDFLPDVLSDFGGTANVSLVSFDPPHIRMGDGTLRRLPQMFESSKFVLNVALLYSHDAFSGEVAYNYTSKMPITFDTTNAVNDQWWAGLSNLDAQVSYKLDENISFRVQGKNLLNSRPQKVVGVTQQLNYSALDNGRAFWVGVGANF